MKTLLSLILILNLTCVGAELMQVLETGEVRTNADSNRLSQTQQDALKARVASLEDKANEWQSKSTQFPNEPIWQQMATRNRDAAAALRNATILQEDMSLWSIGPGATGIAAYAPWSGVYYINRPQLGMLSDPKEIVAFEAYMLHEYIHSTQLFYEKGEAAAYEAQYVYLVLSGFPTDSKHYTNTLGRLQELGVLTNISEGEKDLLNQRLGLAGHIARTTVNDAIVGVVLPKPPKAGTSDQIEAWRRSSLALLNPDTDPARVANKEAAILAADAIHAHDERFICRNCRVEVKHWWTNGNQWQCPACELCTFIVDLRRTDGRTYGEYAQECIRAVQARREQVNKDADAMLAGRGL